jgi:plasmid maintenance system antidote protein VapI
LVSGFLRLTRYFDGSAEFWLGLQKDYELRLARQESLPRIAREIQPRVENA